MACPSFDIAVTGAGFAGSLIALIARRLGKSVVLIERTRHPRFAIGESSTPLTNLLLEELAHRYELRDILPLSKYGTWRHSFPQIACGLKRGFTFLHHSWDLPFQTEADHRNQLLVAASPHDLIADTHWYRPDFDHHFLRCAREAGVEYYDQTHLRSARFDAEGVALSGARLGQPMEFRARFLMDASGRNGFLPDALNLPAQPFEFLPVIHGLYSHFKGVKRLEEMKLFNHEAPPYPVDDAAVHHLFPGGWIWVLRFNNGLTSAGVAATDSLAQELNLSEGRAGWQRLLARLPTVRDQFQKSEAEIPFFFAPRLPFRRGPMAGSDWVLLPSAAGFIDPLLSTGFPLTLLGIRRLAKVLEEDWETKRLAQQLQNYGAQCTGELLAAELLIAALYAQLNDFELFRALTLLYFAAVSFSETARRLERPELADGFLLCGHSHFGPAMKSICKEALTAASPGEKSDLARRIGALIEPYDVAGLGDRTRRHWHPAQAEDLLNSAAKLGVSREQMKTLLIRCGMISEARA